MLETLRAHRARYPLMTPQDAVKLIYQRAFGPGHLIESREDALDALQEEARRTLKDAAAPLFEPIGGGLVRMHLASPDFPRLETAAGMFFTSASQRQGCDFQRELDALVEAWPECAPYVADYRSKGCLPVSHSDAFRAAYHPAYRVVLAKFQRLFEVFRRIDALLAQKPSVLVAIDGRCGSGKSSLAALIASVYGATALHMDDFFQTEAQKAAGEAPAVANIDGARLQSALVPLKEGIPFEIRPYNCLTGEFLPPCRLSPARVRVVEGSYCLHPSISLDYDLKLFVTVDAKTQRARIASRNPALYDRFVAEWIPNEEAYFSAFRVAESCLRVNGLALGEQDGDENACEG
jgi:hypothetical protein